MGARKKKIIFFKMQKERGKGPETVYLEKQQQGELCLRSSHQSLLGQAPRLLAQHPP